MNFRSRRLLLLGVIGLVVSGMAWQLGKARSLAGTPAAARSGTIAASLEFGGRTRTYLLHVPPGYDSKTPLPLVFVLHGATQSDGSAERMSGMSAKTDREHFIAVYPNGTGRLSDVPTWNAGNCCGYAVQNGVDDIGFFRALIENLERDYPVDRKRIYFTGISNGAMMSYRVSCEMSGQVAAIAPVEGALNVDCHPSSPVAVLIFYGTADRLVPFNGGTTPFQIGDKRSDNSVAGAVNFWVKRDGCSAAPRHKNDSEAHVDEYTGCQDGTGVTLSTRSRVDTTCGPASPLAATAFPQQI